MLFAGDAYLVKELILRHTGAVDVQFGFQLGFTGVSIGGGDIKRLGRQCDLAFTLGQFVGFAALDFQPFLLLIARNTLTLKLQIDRNPFQFDLLLALHLRLFNGSASFDLAALIGLFGTDPGGCQGLFMGNS